jgi:hypothetical protein
MIVYAISPIDDWCGWQKPSDVFRVSDGYNDWDNVTQWLRPKDWEAAWARARALAKSLGWEGDTTFGPYVSVLPDPSNSPFLIVWKQSNNGTTFVASPYELPWLDEHTDAQIRG